MGRALPVGRALKDAVVARTQILRQRARRRLAQQTEKRQVPVPTSLDRRSVLDSRDPDADPSLPSGRYVIVASRLTPTYGGLTASLFARARTFAQQGHTPVDIVTLPAPWFDSDPTAYLTERGILPDRGVRVRCPHLHYSTHQWDAESKVLAPHPALESVTTNGGEFRPDGTVIRMDHFDASEVKVREDFLRRDGSTYLRRHIAQDEKGSEWTDVVECLDHEEQVREQHPTMPALHRAWFQHEYPPSDETTYVIIDGPSAGRQLLSMKRSDLLRFVVVHNRHLKSPCRWDGELEGTRADFFTKLDKLDGLVLLTDQQRHDVVLRCGPRRNLFTVSHAAEQVPSPPDPARRDPDLIVVIARFAHQKRLDHLLRAFKIIHDRRPATRLRIYGSGPAEESLRALVSKLGLEQAVQLPGHVPEASDDYAVATLTMMSSRFEGQPIVILEALGRGCPMVSYDLKYGPAHMIENGHNGTLVPEGDIAGLAEAALQVLDDPGQAAQLSRQAWQSAGQFDSTHFLAQWGDALRTAAQQRDIRTRFDMVQLTVLNRQLSEAGQHIRAEVKITGALPDNTDQLDVRWLLTSRASAVQREGAASVTVRSASRRGLVFTVDDVLDVDGTLADGAPGEAADLHLDIVWNNSQERQAVPSA